MVDITLDGKPYVVHLCREAGDVDLGDEIKEVRDRWGRDVTNAVDMVSVVEAVERELAVLDDDGQDWASGRDS